MGAPEFMLRSPNFRPKAATAQTECEGLISIHGAREHNLKNISVSLPRNCFVVVTGVSGSGKSTLAFDILFAEGQRRFLDSMNVYARQFVEQLARPDVDLISGIPPTVSIEQRTSRGGGKSTVATVTEVYHFLRLLFARLGTQYCPKCNVPVADQTRDELARSLQAELRRRGNLLLLAPVVRNRKGFHTDVAQWAIKHGYSHLRADGKLHPTDEPFRLDRFREHDVEIVTGSLSAKARLTGAGGPRKPLAAREEMPAGELLDETLKLGNGVLFALDDAGHITIHSTERSCPSCGRSFEPLDPKNFSYNSPRGWCPRCRGFGELFYLPEVDRGARADAIEESWYEWQEGDRELCTECRGSRLNPIARAVRLHVDGLRTHAEIKGDYPTIDTLSGLSVEAASALFRRLKFMGRAGLIARDILPEIRERLLFLCEVGLGYLELGRAVPTLSGGESQRIRLAAQLGSNLSGVLYILDEPTIGLHARDNRQLLAALQKLKSRGNSVLVVEHDEDTMRQADYILDLGPGAGVHGGEVVAAGSLSQLMRHPESITGKCLRASKAYPTRGSRHPVTPTPQAEEHRRDRVGAEVPAVSDFEFRISNFSPKWLVLAHAQKNNLKDLTVSFPLGRFVCVTGVSGSGKSTLIGDCLLPALQTALKTRKATSPASRKSGEATVSDFDLIQSVYEVDQSPIGRTPRSVPATYVGFFDHIRQLFAQVPEARLRGYSPARFSFNSVHGRCPECQGAGNLKLEMSFLPPAFVRCESCNGTRFNRETLEIEYGGRNIAQVLELSVEQAAEAFANIRKINKPLQALCDTGLGYLKLGQTSPTLSGGEAQRLRLVTHLISGLSSEPGLFDRLARRNLFVLEEPTIGLHMADVQRLVDVLQRLVDAGHSVIVIEHNLDLVAEADWVIDLGPEGGAQGGRVVAQGTPEDIASNKRSHTGEFLRKVLRPGK